MRIRPVDGAGAALALALGTAIALLPPPKTDNSVDSLLTGGTEAVKTYRRFLEKFSEEDVLVVQVGGRDAAERAAEVRRLDTLLSESPAVRDVVSAARAYDSELAVLEDPAFDATRAWEQLDRPLNRSLKLFREDAAHLYAFLSEGPSPEKEALMTALRAHEPEPRFAGSARLNEALDAQGREVETQVLPLVAVLALAILVINLRRVGLVAAALLPVGLGVLGGDRLFALLGGTSNILVGVSRPLTFVILLASSLHLVSAWAKLRHEGVPAEEAPARALRAKAKAILLAVGTTSVGFASLIPSGVGPIRSFGLASTLGLVLGLPLLLGGVPLALRWFGGTSLPRTTHSLNRLAISIVTAGARRPVPAVAGAFVLITAGIVAGLNLEPDSLAIHYFPPDDPIRQDHHALEQAGVGLQSLEVLVTSDRPLLARSETRMALEAAAAAIAELDGVENRLDPLLILREASLRTGGPDAPMEPDLLQTLAEVPPGWSRLVANDGRSVRMPFLLRTVDADRLDGLESQIRAIFDGRPGLEAAQIQVTGSYRLIQEAQRALLSTLWTSLGITLLVMQLVVIGALGSLRTGLLAVIPNLLPVATNFGVMWLFGLPLDLGTSMVAALALGIAVDDTLHFGLAAQRLGSPEAARCEGRAILLSSITIGAGFAGLMVSSFRPTFAFGLLCSSAMLWALAGDLWVFPALLRLARRA